MGPEHEPSARVTGGEENLRFDYIVIGSGFGGSVSALRLVERGYRVLLLEKGGRKRAEDFPSSNWQLKRWLWMPRLGWRGIFRMTFLPHLTALSGVGVGGGSLVYANTLPRPKSGFLRPRAGLIWRTGLMSSNHTIARLRGCWGLHRTSFHRTRTTCCGTWLTSSGATNTTN